MLNNDSRRNSIPPSPRLHASHDLNIRGSRLSNKPSPESNTATSGTLLPEASSLETTWWQRFRLALCSSVLREELRGDFSSALSIADSALQQHSLSSCERTDALFSKGLSLLLSGRPQAAMTVLDEMKSHMEDRRDDARHLRYLVWLYIAREEAHAMALDDSNMADDVLLRARFGWPESNVSELRSRQTKIKEVRQITVDRVSVEECELFNAIVFYRLAKMYGYSLCPANVAVPVPERAYLEKASHWIKYARRPPPLARGCGFAQRQYIRLCSMCLPREMIVQNMMTYIPMHDDHDRGLALLLECDLILCRVGTTVEYWGTIAALGGWSTLTAGVLVEEFYRPTAHELDRASKLIQDAHELFDEVNSPRGVASAYIRKSYCAVLDSRWNEGKQYALIAFDRFRAVKDAYGQNVAQLHVVLASIGESPLIDPSSMAFPIGEWGIGCGSYSVAVSLGRLLLRVASQYWLVRNGRIMEALGCCRAARGLFEALKAPLGIADALFSESQVLSFCGARHEEITLLQDALMVLTKMGKVSSETKEARRNLIADIAGGLLRAYLSLESQITGLERLLDDVKELFGLPRGESSIEGAKELLRMFGHFFRDSSSPVSGTASNAKAPFIILHYVTLMTQVLVPAIKAYHLQFRPEAREEFQRLETLALYNIDVLAGNPREKEFCMFLVHGLLHNYEEQKKAALEHFHLFSECSINPILDIVHLQDVTSMNPDGTRMQRTKDITEVQGYLSLDLRTCFSILIKAEAWPEARECLESLNKFLGTSNWWRLDLDNLSYGERIAVLLSKEGKYEEAIKLFDECISFSESTLRSIPDVEKRSYRLRSASPSLLFQAARAVFNYLIVSEAQNRDTHKLCERLFAYLDATKARTMLDLEASNKLLSRPADSQSIVTASSHSHSDDLDGSMTSGNAHGRLDAEALPEEHSTVANIAAWQKLVWHRAALARITAKLHVEGYSTPEQVLASSEASEWRRRRLKKAKNALDYCDKKLHEVGQKLLRDSPVVAKWMKTQGDTLSLGEVQACLPSSVLLVQYFVSARHVFILIATKNHGLIERKLVEMPEKKLQALVERFVSVCATEPLAALAPVVDLRSEYSEAAEGISSTLIDPIKACLHDACQSTEGERVRLIIVPHRCLNDLPFHALPWEDAEPLGSSFVISYLHSASELQFYGKGSVTNPIQIRGGRSLLVGNPCHMSHVHPVSGIRSQESALEGSAEEVITLQSVLREHEVSCCVLTDESANLNRLREWLSEEVGQGPTSTSTILHLATHFVYVRDAPLMSAFLLANGEKLTVLELSTQRTELDLVVLSACSSAHGESTIGGDFYGAVEALRAAGVRRIVASLWPVRDVVARETMTAFYKRVLEGHEPAEALRRTQGLLRQRFEHPCYWAPFTLIG